MKYGLPYKGSKNKLAERIVRLLPRRTHLVDLFCGGCAVSHAALVMGKYEHIHINDNNWMCPTLFMDALAGKYNDEKRWISREDFFRLRDTDPYVAVVWSFGNNLRDYLYSQEIEPLKKAIHYAIFFSDYSLGKELGHDLSFINGVSDVQKRYLLIKRYFSRFGHFQQQSFFGGQTQVEHNTRKQRISQIGAEFSRLQSAEANVRLNTNLQSWGGTRRIHKIGDCRKTAQYLSEYHPLERTTGGGGAVKRPSKLQRMDYRPRIAAIQKNCKRPWESEHRERANSIAFACSIGSDSTVCQPFRANIADYIKCA